MRGCDLSITYAENAERHAYSDAEKVSCMDKATIMDPDLDCYALGLLMRLEVLAYFGHDWKKIFEYDDAELVVEYMKELHENGYLTIQPDGRITNLY